MRDGVELLADNYEAADPSAGTVRIGSPYGASAVVASVFAGPYIAAPSRRAGALPWDVRIRGAFEPMFREVDDSADTVAWLRAQPWFGGRFGTVGPPYLGFTQWAMLMGTRPPSSPPRSFRSAARLQPLRLRRRRLQPE